MTMCVSTIYSQIIGVQSAEIEDFTVQENE